MAVLSNATGDDLIHLLELFPVSKIKDHWPKFKGRKEDVAKDVVASEKRPAIAAFVDKYFSCCKQHIYVLGNGGEVKKSPPAGHADGERILEQEGKSEGSALYLYWAEFTAVLTDPYEDATLKFLWPFRFEFTKTNVFIRLVVIEKNLSAHFGG